MINHPEKEIRDLANYIKGMADALQNAKLSEASEWLRKLSDNICGQGYIGCHGGKECDSNHK